MNNDSDGKINVSMIEKDDDSSYNSSKSSRSSKSSSSKSSRSSRSSGSLNSSAVKKFPETTTDLGLEAFADSVKLKDPSNIKAYEDMKKNLSTIDEDNSSRTSGSSSSGSSSSSSSRSSKSSKSSKGDDIESYMKNKSHGDFLHSSSHNVKNGNKEGILDEKTGLLLTEDELEIRKLDMIRKLGELTQYGVQLSDNYSLSHPYKKMKHEYELHTGVRKKKNSVMFMRSTLLSVVFGMEILSTSDINPFSIDLNGWSKVMSSEVDSYYDIFGEIYEKYQQPGKDIDPLFKLCLMVGASAIQFSMSKSMLAMMSGMTDGLKNDPAKQEKLRQLAINQRLEASQKEKEAMNKYMTSQHNGINNQLNERQLIEQARAGNIQARQINDPQLENMEKMLEKSISTQNSSPLKNTNRIQLPPALQNKLNNNPMMQRNIQENLLRQQMAQNSNPLNMPINPNLSPLQQEQFRQQEIARQNREMIERETIRRELEAKKIKEEAMRKIQEEYDERNADARSKGTISDDVDEAIQSFYSNKKNNNKDSSILINESPPKKTRGRKKAVKNV
jgi:hypothetical protein